MKSAGGHLFRMKLKKWLYTALTAGLALTACSSLNPGFTPIRSGSIPVRLAAAAQDITPSAATDLRNPGRIWQDEIIYFIFTDRFANGNRSNDFNVKANDPWAYHGGDLDGVIQKLDYIKDLGATAIWLTPVIDNRDEAFVADFGGGHMQEIWGYHGYWFKDFYKVDEHLGDMNKLRQLTQAAHSKGIKVLLDIVVNHTDYDHPFAQQAKDPNSKYHSWFHHNGVIKNWDDQWWVENGELAELPDLNQDNAEANRYVIDAMKFWIKESGADGFRIDTVKHVPHSFWRQFNREIRAYAGDDFLLLGEIYTPSPEFQAPYLREGMHSAFDFPLYYTLKDVWGQGGSMRSLSTHFAKDRLYPDASLLSPFLDNHDVPRFVHEANGRQRDRLKAALGFLFTIRGMPMLYYGTEVALPGGADPDNRRDMVFGRDQELTQYVKSLTQLRKQYPALRRGKQLEMWQDDNVYAFTRMTDKPNEEVIAFFNNSLQAQSREVPLRAESPWKNSSASLVNVFNTQDVLPIQGGQVQVTIPPLGYVIYRVAG